MGLYDTVNFRCPKCDGLISEQSKAGECGLYDFDSDSVPKGIANAILGKTVYCETCGEYEIVMLNNPENVRMGLVKKL